MNCIRFSLIINSDTYLAYYAGQAKSISVQAHDGRRIQFPAEHLREFVTHDGISGDFEICFDEQYRFISIRKLS